MIKHLLAAAACAQRACSAKGAAGCGADGGLTEEGEPCISLRRRVGGVGGNLQRTPYGGPSQVVLPGIGNVRGTRFLSDGTLVMAQMDENSLIRVDPSYGSVTLVRGGLDIPNGIAIGLDGWIYVATRGQIVRVHPDTGELEIVADVPNTSFDGLTFSPDYTRLYFNEEIGQLYWVDFDSDNNPLEPVAGPILPIGFMSILDGMTADACGNIYIIEMQGKLWRISPEGEIEVVVEIPNSFLPAVNFGSGIGGFEATRVYIMDFLGKLYSADVGVPGKYEPHLP